MSSSVQRQFMAGGFFVGLHHPHVAHRFDQCCVSVNALRRRKSDFPVNRWMMDSGAFTELSRHGGYRHETHEYAWQVRRWSRCGELVAAASQDWMCEPHIIERTGLSVAEHQRRTIARYDALLADRLPVYLLPVIQGYEPKEYVAHLGQYGDRLAQNAWVGVGSVCKRNGDPRAIERVLLAIYDKRPDLRLHGFGIKRTALRSGTVQRLLWSADSMAWSWAARKQGRDANDWREAAAFKASIESQVFQMPLFV